MSDITQFLTTSREIARSPELKKLLRGTIHFHRRGLSVPNKNGAYVVLGWGRKANTNRAVELSKKQGCSLWRLEDGFISYLGHPALGDRRFSLIVDKVGIYYDACQPSELEQLLNQPDWLTPELEKRSLQLIDRLCTNYISKYNHEPIGHWQVPPESKGKAKILVVDQTFGDCSVSCGMARADSFKAMLYAALRENLEADIWVKVHPDVMLGKKQGYFPVENGHIKGVSDDRVRVLADKVNAQSLFSHFEKVYVVTSQLGFEALLHNKTVVCFGVPFYSGWGLTDDRVSCERRVQTHALASLFAAACLLYTRYIDPETGDPCELEDVLELVALQRRYQQPEVRQLYALGFSLWKRTFVKEFTAGLAKNMSFVRNHRALKKQLAQTPQNTGLLIWGRKPLPKGVDAASMPVWRMEDGFIRSCGLGADLRRPASLVLDNQCIYYDATTPSRLECLLNTAELALEEVERGEALIALLLQNRISKYNLAGNENELFSGAKECQRRILVTGQVDSDASLKYGSPVIFRNGDLLAQVRQWLNKQGIDAYMVYKPHPDVVRAGRQGHVAESEALKYVDRVVVDNDIFDCISQCDELHVMTSQAGFEGLLQGKDIHCWGMPFYAGWGLTQDHMADRAIEHRRQCRRTLAELVYLTLCEYPRYVHWKTRRFTTPERVVKALAQQRDKTNGQYKETGWLGRKYRKVQFLLEAILT